MKENNFETKILELFPKTVFISKIDRNLNNKELKEIDKQKKEVFQNTGNKSTINSYVLNLPIFKTLKKEIMDRVNFYCYKVLRLNPQVKPYITQSWLNYTKENEYHHLHAHPNSYISGVYYVDGNSSNDTITFWDTNYYQIEPEYNELNKYNSTSWWMPTVTKDLFLFKSELKHSVTLKKGNNTRTSLAFNIFFKGKLGKKKNLTELVI